jgi:hypothetical protein
MANEEKLRERLSPEDREHWDQDGYLILDSLVPDSTIESIAAEADDLYRDMPEGERQVEDGVMYTWNRIMDAWRISENVSSRR